MRSCPSGFLHSPSSSTVYTPTPLNRVRTKLEQNELCSSSSSRLVLGIKWPDAFLSDRCKCGQKENSEERVVWEKQYAGKWWDVAMQEFSLQGKRSEPH